MIVFNVLDNIELFDIDKLTELLTSKWSDNDKPLSDLTAIIWLKFMEHWYASNDQRVITGIGLSDCSLLFSIGTFHTNSCLCRPVDSTEFITPNAFGPGLYSTFASSLSISLGGHLRRRFHLVIICGGEPTTVTAADRDVGCATLQKPASAGALSTPLLPPTTSSSSCLRRCRHGRRRRQRNPTPAADSDVGGTTLQPASAGIWAGLVRRMPNGIATFWAEHLLQSKAHLQSKICLPLHFNPDSAAADRIGNFQIA